MRRGGPLKRRTQLRANTPMRRTRVKKKRPIPEVLEAWQAAREQIYARAGGRCERCGTSLDHSGMDAHHRKLRSRRGGDELSNLVALCPKDHRWVHAHPTAAFLEGWMISSRTLPATIPITLPSGRTVWLDNAGTYTEGWAA